MGFLKDFKVIWIYLRKYKKEVVKISFLAVFFALFSGIIPYIYGRLVDMVDSGSFSFLVFALLGVWALTGLISETFRRVVCLRGGFIGA